MSTVVSNPSGDHNDKIANAAKVLGRSKDRKKVFLAVYGGKKKVKTVADIIKTTGLTNIRVLQEADKLHGADILKKIRDNGETAYQKIDFYTHNKKQIVRLSNDKKKFRAFPTKVNPNGQGKEIRVVFPKKLINFQEITVDDIQSFAKVRKVKASVSKSQPIAEKRIKLGFQKIIGDKGKFTDWGGEINDLFTSRIQLKSSRVSVAFAFKGKATTGVLTPKKLGKNGDQIQRLFKSPAQIFIIQYQGQIDQSVVEQMRTFAIAKSVTESTKIYFGIIDGQDTTRLLQAYPKQFK